MRISEAFRIYAKNQILAIGGSAKTYEGYTYSMKAAIKHFGDIEVEDIELEGVAEWYIEMDKRLSKNTARGYVIALRAVIRYCRRIGLDVINADDIRVPKRQKKAAAFLSEDEVEEFIEVACTPKRGYARVNQVRNRLIIKMLFSTGLRVGELVALDRDSIKGRHFVVVGKSKNPRPCYITEEVEGLIGEYLELRQDECKALFVSCHGRKVQRITKGSIQRIFRRTCQQGGFDGIHPHTMRHSYGTHLVEKGVDIRLVCELLGHQSLSTTQLYTHITDRRLRLAYEAAMG